MATDAQSSFSRWLANLPTVNFKLFSGQVLAILTVLNVNVMMWRMVLTQREQYLSDALWPICIFIGAMLGVNVWAYKVKRDTWQPDAPQPEDVTSPPAPGPGTAAAPVKVAVPVTHIAAGASSTEATD